MVSTGSSPFVRIITDQRVAFLMVGGVNTVLGYALFVLFQIAFGNGLGRFGYMASLVSSYSVGILCAFCLHRYLVFRVRGHFWLDLGRFVVVNLGGLGINAVLLPLVIETTGARPTLAQAGVTLFTALASYFGHKFFSFRRRPVRQDSGPIS
ncbi:MAG TPA: GtrA family protein [Gryllotalpicola sp.]